MPSNDLLDRFLADFEQFLAGFVSSASAGSSAGASSEAPSQPAAPESAAPATPPAASLSASIADSPAQVHFTPDNPANSASSPLIDPGLSPQVSSQGLSQFFSQLLSTSPLAALAGDAPPAASPQAADVSPTPDHPIAAEPASSSSSIASTERLLDVAQQALDHLSTISATLDRIQLRLDSLGDQQPVAVFA